jgi:hypothetical protein
VNKKKIRETLYISSDISLLSFDISSAGDYFLKLLRDEGFVVDSYDKYLSIQVSTDEMGGGFSIEGVRMETDLELEERKRITLNRKYGI